MIKFLIIRFSSIGDIVLTTPVLRNLKKKFPDCEIHFLTKPQFSFILDENPYIDKLIVLDDSLKETIQELRNERYDYLIDLHNNLRTRRIKSALSIPDFTVDKLNYKKWLLVNFKINKLPKKHVVERYLDTLSVFDVANDQEGLDYFIKENDKISLNQFDDEFTGEYIAFVVGATYFTKQIPVDVAIEIINKTKLPFVLLGGKDDLGRASEIESKTNAPLVNLCGKISLNQSASVIQQSKLVVSSDTGLMHIAAAYHKPIVSLWGNTVPEFGMTPYLSHNNSMIFENKELRCRPCSKIGFNKCPKKHFDCMKKLDIEAISKNIIDLYVG